MKDIERNEKDSSWFHFFGHKKSQPNDAKDTSTVLKKKTVDAEKRRKNAKLQLERFLKATAPPMPSGNFSEPTFVMLLSYQRSGSSFMGNLVNK